MFLGTAIVMPGQFNPMGTFLGIYFLETGILGLQLLGYSGWVQDAFYGAGLVAAVTVATSSAPVPHRVASPAPPAGVSTPILEDTMRFIKANTSRARGSGVLRADGVVELCRSPRSRLEAYFGDDGEALRELGEAIHADPAASRPGESGPAQAGRPGGDA